MSNHTYKTIELTGTSNKSVEEAIQNAVSRASRTIEEMRWFEVTEIRGNINKNLVNQWQVSFKVGFTIKDE
ncbi:MAG: dodecin domain-containing protein [Balneolaceae bacterium]|jgi:flavin-binding protein dodecin|nr:MAG: dodecin domain-containing protein [Balneolaceae bacterium]